MKKEERVKNDKKFGKWLSRGEIREESKGKVKRKKECRKKKGIQRHSLSACVRICVLSELYKQRGNACVCVCVCVCV